MRLRFSTAFAAALAALAAAAPTTLRAQTPAAQAAPAGAGLEFLGFRAGDSLRAIGDRVHELDGRALRCDRARADRRVQECRATIIDPDQGAPIELWVSAIDSVAGVITLSGPVESGQLDRWRDGLETRYGRAGAKVQGPQWSMQWVRRGRMIRLTWRVERRDKVASVSLIDGRVLDGWGRERAAKGKG
jgi:hypothetical protein